MTKRAKNPGPKPDRVKIDEDWEDAVDKALKKEKPERGWPKPDDEKAPESHSEGDSEG